MGFSERLAMARASATSYERNPRNIEFPWYAFWNLICFRWCVTIHTSQCNVSPQYPLWRLHIYDEDPDTLPVVTPVAEDEDNDGAMNWEADVADTSMISNETLSKTTRCRITDFAIIYHVPKDDFLDSEFIPVLIENKRAASRALTGPAWHEAMQTYLNRASEDVLKQAVYLFCSPQWARQTSVCCVATSGDYWTYTVVDRGACPAQRLPRNDEEDVEWEPIPPTIPAESWVKSMRYGTQKSKDHELVISRWIHDYFIPVHERNKDSEEDGDKAGHANNARRVSGSGGVNDAAAVHRRVGNAGVVDDHEMVDEPEGEGDDDDAEDIYGDNDDENDLDYEYEAEDESEDEHSE